MFATLLSLLTVAAIALAAYGVGRPLVRALRLDLEDPLAVATWSTGLGLVAWGTLWMALGLCGLLMRELIGVTTIAGAFWGLGELLRTCLKRSTTCSVAAVTEPSRIPPPSRSFLLALAAVCAVTLVGTMTSALAPPTAGDALCYHLELPKRFLAEERLVYFPDHDNSTFPLLVEMWYLWALALDGGVAAQLVHGWLGIMLALSAVVLARRFVGREWAWLAGAIVLAVPGVTNQMSAPLNDVGLAVMTTLAFAAWWRAVIDDESRAWYVVSGIFLGGACGTKYLALVFAAAWFGVWLAHALRAQADRRAWARGAMVMGVLAVAIAGPWYARSAWYRGNPVYPFFHASASDDVPETIRASKLALGRAPWNLAAAPWVVTMHPERFGGRGHQLGCLLLAMLPGLFIARRLRGVRLLLAVSGCYFLACFLLRQNVRFLFPLLPLWAAPCAWVWIELKRFPNGSRQLVALSLAGMFLLGAAWPVARARHHWQVALGLETRAEYLQRTEPSYAAAMLANLIVDDQTRILSQENRGFYFDTPVTVEALYRRRTHYDRSSENVAGKLFRDGFRYLVLAEASGPGIQYDPTLSQLVDRSLVSGELSGFRQLTEYDFQDSDGARRHYRLIRIEPTFAAARSSTIR